MKRTAALLAFCTFVALVGPAGAEPGAQWAELGFSRDRLVGDELLVNPREPWVNHRSLTELRAGSFEGCPHDFDVLHYELNFDSFNEASLMLSGQTDVRFVSQIDGLSTIDLDLTDGLTVSSILRDGTTPQSFSHASDVLSITLTPSLDTGDTTSVVIAYSGTPANEGSGGFGGFWFTPFPKNAFSMGVGLFADPPSMGRTWFPCYDWPCDKATVDLNIEVPLNRMAVANGQLVSVDSTATDHTFHWSHDYPVSTYLIAMSAAPYRLLADSIITDPRIDVYFHAGNRTESEVSFQFVDLMMEALESRFGPYPYDAFKFMTTWKGDMEHQTCVSHQLSLVNGSNNFDFILAHELGHQWFGDCVTYGDWRDTWLSEGFATYCEALFPEYQSGTAAYHAAMTGIMNQVLNSGQTDGVYAPSERWGTVAYEKGASVLHMLRGVLDDDAAFFQVMRDYHANHAYANAVTSDFVADVNASLGADYTWFLDPWLYGEGHPVYQYGWSTVDLGGGQHRVDVAISQVQTTASIFDLPVDFRVQTASGDFDFSEQIDQASQLVSFIVPAVPTGLLVDPDDWILDEQQLSPTSVDFGPEIAAGQRLQLHTGRPNPFRARTEIRYYVPSAGPVELSIFDVTGRRVRTLTRGAEEIGARSIWWDGRTADGGRVAPGVYAVRLEAREGVLSEKVVLSD